MNLSTGRSAVRFPRVLVRMILFVVGCVAVTVTASAQATVTTVDGKEYTGRVINEGGDAITIMGADSTEMKILRTRIRAVVYGTMPVGPGATGSPATPSTTPSATPSAASTSDTSVPAAPVAEVPEKENFPILGGALGTPAGLNLVAGYYFGGFGARFSGMYLSSMRGFQIDFLRNISRSKTFSHNIHLGFGMSHLELPSEYYYLDDEVSTWNYLTLGYDINWSEFHLAAGLSVGNGTYSNPQLMLQFGYVHEFR